MWRMLAVLRRNIQNIRKSPKVADENMFGGGTNGGHDHHHQQQQLPIFMDRRQPRSLNGLSIICSVVRAPLSFICCFSQPHVNGADGVWVSGEFAQISEMNHLMVSDSMRYAILM